VVLGIAMALSATLGLWLTRGTTFFVDELTYFVADRGFDLRALLSGHNGHLIAVTRLIYAVVLKLFGADYLPFRLLEVFGIALVSGLFFVLAKRRIGAAAALAPSVVLLFLGSSGEVTLTPLGITHVYSVATGLGALLALERRDRWGDLGACALVSVSAATFTIGLAFLAGIAVSVLLREDRRRRAWIFVIPIALYCAWFLAAPELTGPAFSKSSGVQLSNVLLIPNFVADAAASVAAALSGLFYFSNSASDTISSPWGNMIAGLALLALVLRLRRGRTPASLWTSLAVLLGFWIPIVLTEPGRPPGAVRYIYAGSVAVLLVATDAAKGLRLSRGELLTLFAAATRALGANVAQFRSLSGVLRTQASQVRAQLTAIQLARDRVDPAFLPAAGPLQSFTQNPNLAARAGSLLAAVDRVGSFALPRGAAKAAGAGARARRLHAGRRVATQLDSRAAAGGRPEMRTNWRAWRDTARAFSTPARSRASLLSRAARDPRPLRHRALGRRRAARSGSLRITGNPGRSSRRELASRVPRRQPADGLRATVSIRAGRAVGFLRESRKLAGSAERAGVPPNAGGPAIRAE
jgi:hypothetical protein